MIVLGDNGANGGTEISNDKEKIRQDSLRRQKSTGKMIEESIERGCLIVKSIARG